MKAAAAAVQQSVDEVTLFANAPLRITLKIVTKVKSSTPRQKSVAGMLTISAKVFTQFLFRHALGPYEYEAFQPPSVGVTPVKYWREDTKQRVHEFVVGGGKWKK